MGLILVAIGGRLCFLYEQITITKLDRDILVEGYWFNSEFRVKQRELRAVQNHGRGILNPPHRSLCLLFEKAREVVIYSSLWDEATQQDAKLLARFLRVPCRRETTWNRLNKRPGLASKALWSRKKHRKDKEA